MRIVADTGLCEGYGECRFNAPAFFDVSEEGSVVILVEEPDEADRETVEQAVSACPKQALAVHD